MSYIGQELGQGRASRETFTASGGETSVNTNYTPGQLSVYLNGVKLVDVIDFTATNGTSVTGLTALVANDVMDFVALENFLVSNTVEATGGTFLGVVTLPSPVINTGVSGSAILDSDSMSGVSATKLSSSESIKAYVDAQSHISEGTAVLSTGETGTSKFLRIDGDGTSSWQTVVTGVPFTATATNNLGIGTNTVDSISTGDYNVGLGDNALTATDTGIQNTGIGYNALRNNADGNYNTACGDQSLVSNITGDSNSAFGQNTLGLCTGHQNTGVGNSALYNCTGNFNVAIGKSSALSLTSGSSNITIGTDVNVVSATASNQLNIGNTIYGDLSTKRVGIGKTVPAQLLHLYGAVPSMLFEDSTNGNLAYLGDAVDFLTSGAVADSFGIRSEGDIRFGTNGNNLRMTIDTSGHVAPGADNAQDLGSSSKRWRNIYTTDLHLANERGNWTVIEEEDYLTLRNNKTNKVYKLVMEEIE